MDAKAPSESFTEMTELVLPQHTNAIGTAFGGVIMSWIDICASIAAKRHCERVSVTARIAWIQRQIEAVLGIDTLPASVYQFSTLPAELDPGQIATAVAMALVLSLGATLLPSRQGAKLDPVEALRYE